MFAQGVTQAFDTIPMQAQSGSDHQLFIANRSQLVSNHLFLCRIYAEDCRL